MSLRLVLALLCIRGGTGYRFGLDHRREALKSIVNQPPTFAVVGNTGAGKSAFLSFLASDLQKFESKAANESVTSKVFYDTLPLFGSPKHGDVTLVDTPGFQDTKNRDVEFLQDMVQAFREVKRVHRFVWILDSSNPRISHDKTNVMKIFRAVIGPSLWSHVDIVLTRFPWQYISKRTNISESLVNEALLEERRKSWMKVIEQIETEFTEEKLSLSDLQIYGVDLNVELVLRPALAEKLTVEDLCWQEKGDEFREEIIMEEGATGATKLTKTCSALRRFQERVQNDARDGHQLDTNALANPIQTCNAAQPPMGDDMHKDAKVKHVAESLCSCIQSGININILIGNQRVPGLKTLKELYEKEVSGSVAIAFQVKSLKPSLDTLKFFPENVLKATTQHQDFKSWKDCEDATPQSVLDDGKLALALVSCVKGILEPGQSVLDQLGRDWQDHLTKLQNILVLMDSEERMEVASRAHIQLEIATVIKVLLVDETISSSSSNLQNHVFKLGKDASIGEIRSKILESKELKDLIGSGPESPTLQIFAKYEGQLVTMNDDETLQMLSRKHSLSGKKTSLELTAQIELPESEGLKEIGRNDPEFKKQLKLALGWPQGWQKVNDIADGLKEDHLTSKSLLTHAEINEKDMPNTFKKMTKTGDTDKMKEAFGKIQKEEDEKDAAKQNIKELKGLEDVRKEYEGIFAELAPLQKKFLEGADGGKKLQKNVQQRIKDLAQRMKEVDVSESARLFKLISMDPADVKAELASMTKDWGTSLSSISKAPKSAMQLIRGHTLLHGRLLTSPLGNMDAKGKLVRLATRDPEHLLVTPTSASDGRKTTKRLTFASEKNRDEGENIFAAGGYSFGVAVCAHSAGRLGADVGAVTASATAAYANHTQSDLMEQTKLRERIAVEMTVVSEPRKAIHIDADDLELLPHITATLQAANKLTGKTRDRRLQSFLQEYGSHICARVVLGGTMILEQKFSASSEVKRYELEKMSADEFQKRADLAASYTGFRGVIKGGAGGRYDNDKDHIESKALGDAKAEGVKMSQFYASYLGGEAGLPPSLWRSSLDMNSNWQVIDRKIDSCFPIWRWLQNSTKWGMLGQDMFKVWAKEYLNLPETIQNYESENDIRKQFGPILQGLSAGLRGIRTCDQKNWCMPHGRCDDQSGDCTCDYGYHLSGDASSCVRNECSCSAGTAPKICKTNGADICENCNKGYHLANEKCEENHCECTNGRAVMGSKCRSHRDQACSGCNQYYHLNDRTKSCDRNVCTCQHGRPASQCETHKSESCDRNNCYNNSRWDEYSGTCVNMKYYYWRLYGANKLRLFEVSKSEYNKYKDKYRLLNTEISISCSAYFWIPRFKSDSDEELRQTNSFRCPQLTYCGDTYFYGYFKTSHISDDGYIDGGWRAEIVDN